MNTYRCQPSDPSVRGVQEFPLSGCDQIVPKVHARLTTYYRLSNSTEESRRDIVQLLKLGLCRLASQVPCLTATVSFDLISMRATLHTNSSEDGILFLVTGADVIRTDLPSYVELELDNFAPWKLPKGKTYPEGLINPMAAAAEGHVAGLPASIFQLTFIEGGLILTAAFHHFVVDGPSVELIFRAWAAQCQGREIALNTNRDILSSHEKPGLTKVAELEKTMAAHGCMIESTKPDPKNPWSNLLAEPCKSAIITLSRRSLTSLKAQISGHHPSTMVSVSDCLHAVCWTALTRAKARFVRHGGDQRSYAMFPATVRSRRNPDFPSNFIGNTFFLQGVVLPVRSLLKIPEGLIDAAVAFRESIERVDAAYLKDGIEWVNSIDEPATRTWLSNPPREIDAGFTSWAGMTPYQNWDFGFGPASALRPPASSIPYVVVLPAKVVVDGEEVMEIVISATKDTHSFLKKDEEFRRYVVDYRLEV